MVNCTGVAKVINVISGKKDDRPWAIASVVDNRYAGMKEGKAQYKDVYISLMLSGKTSERFVKVVEQGRFVYFSGEPEPQLYTPKNGGETRANLQIRLDDFNGTWNLVPNATIKPTQVEDEDEEESSEPTTRSTGSTKNSNTEQPDDEDPFP